ncbi:hypothetical protein [Amaricoccus solimangrovi]|uniref:Uncharacterized protein n=1 Tax=Amaricoccus solimangrovi TaxID=2589815 RepID=A0A501WXW7_9RHOB|nr:hypothetical protein [Amaricoccus solimangrovi]TPE53572.1 hypothetical protein FJM51_00535 [Amaricoccus solimangrovi]
MNSIPWPFPALAPRENRQVINPWSFFQNARFALFNVDGQTARPDVERAILDTASYGKQLGRIEDALAVLVRLAEKGGAELTEEDETAFLMLRALLVEIARAKEAALAR